MPGGNSHDVQENRVALLRLFLLRNRHLKRLPIVLKRMRFTLTKVEIYYRYRKRLLLDKYSNV